MKIFQELHEHFVDHLPIVLTIGFFDGVHLGHQKLFKKMNQIKGESGYNYALTFSNHPKTVLKPGSSFPLITTLEHKIDLIKEQEVDALFVLPFSEELKEASADDFLSALMESISFTDLVLGPDATIGKNKEGDLDLLKLLGKKYSFKLHQLETFQMKDTPISSTLIRKAIEEGKIEKASQYLGRPYSIIAPLISGQQEGTKLGFPTLNFDIEDLVIPPLGVYKVKARFNSKDHLAVANIGYAPTVQERKIPVLEVHLLNQKSVETNEKVEIVFEKFIRPEQKFHSLDELKNQIQKDINLIQQT